MRAYSPGGTLNALAPLHEKKIHKASVQRLQPGLLGSLIPFATLAFVPQRQLLPSDLPSPLVFLLISTDITPTLGILITYINNSSLAVSMALSELSPDL